MKEIKNKKKFFTDLIKLAISMEKSGHPILDARWETDGSPNDVGWQGTPRNHCYRRTYYRFCQELVRALKPALVVELGIDEGDCSGHFANGCPDTLVIGVDVHKDDERPSNRCRYIQSNFSNFKYLRGWTWDKVNEVASHGKIDILFIDSWHEYEYMAKDWNDYAPLLADNAIVLVDDLPMKPVKRAFDEIPAEFVMIDDTMSQVNVIGILMGVDKNFKFNFEKQAYMP